MTTDRNLLEAQKFNFESKDQFDLCKKYGSNKNTNICARVQIGDWSGPGIYYLLEYLQPCPRGCCYDDVNEIMTEEEYKKEVLEEISNLNQLLE